VAGVGHGGFWLGIMATRRIPTKRREPTPGPPPRPRGPCAYLGPDAGRVVQLTCGSGAGTLAALRLCLHHERPPRMSKRGNGLLPAAALAEGWCSDLNGSRTVAACVVCPLHRPQALLTGPTER
jgi:hypothetical protein